MVSDVCMMYICMCIGVVPPQSSVAIDITFEPYASQVELGSFTIDVLAGNGPQKTLEITAKGQGGTPVLTVR